MTRVAVFLLVTSVLAASGLAQRPAPPLRYQRPDLEALLRTRRLVAGEAGERVWQAPEHVGCDLCAGDEKTPCKSCRNGEHPLADKCRTCRGKNEIRCRRCAGAGVLMDPLVHMPCPRCDGQPHVLCSTCAGIGRLDVVGGGAPSCVPCGGDGGHPCSVCKGKGRVDVVDADATQLEVADPEQLALTRSRLQALRGDVEALLAAIAKTSTGAQRPTDWQFKDRFDALVEQAAEVHRMWRNEDDATERIGKDLLKRRGDGLWRFGGAERTVTGEYRDATKALGAWVAYQQAAVARCLQRFE